MILAQNNCYFRFFFYVGFICLFILQKNQELKESGENEKKLG